MQSVGVCGWKKSARTFEGSVAELGKLKEKIIAILAGFRFILFSKGKSSMIGFLNGIRMSLRCRAVNVLRVGLYLSYTLPFGQLSFNKIS